MRGFRARTILSIRRFAASKRLGEVFGLSDSFMARLGRRYSSCLPPDIFVSLAFESLGWLMLERWIRTRFRDHTDGLVAVCEDGQVPANDPVALAPLSTLITLTHYTQCIAWRNESERLMKTFYWFPPTTTTIRRRRKQ